MPDLEELVGQLIRSGNVPTELLQLLEEARQDPLRAAEVLQKLRELAGASLQDSLNIADFYKEGDGRTFELRWPLSPSNPLNARGIPFEALDRKTQFFTLFAEWQRREAEGMILLTNGDVTQAESVFRECVERADQVDVAELRARSYENLARAAERRGDQKGVRSWLDKAERASAAA